VEGSLLCHGEGGNGNHGAAGLRRQQQRLGLDDEGLVEEVSAPGPSPGQAKKKRKKPGSAKKGKDGLFRFLKEAGVGVSPADDVERRDDQFRQQVAQSVLRRICRAAR
ncbi:hypothetical protein THAOC_28447, partial [Thalassiosira oceanica]